MFFKSDWGLCKPTHSLYIQFELEPTILDGMSGSQGIMRMACMSNPTCPSLTAQQFVEPTALEEDTRKPLSVVNNTLNHIRVF